MKLHSPTFYATIASLFLALALTQATYLRRSLAMEDEIACFPEWSACIMGGDDCCKGLECGMWAGSPTCLYADNEPNESNPKNVPMDPFLPMNDDIACFPEWFTCTPGSNDCCPELECAEWEGVPTCLDMETIPTLTSDSESTQTTLPMSNDMMCMPVNNPCNGDCPCCKGSQCLFNGDQGDYYCTATHDETILSEAEVNDDDWSSGCMPEYAPCDEAFPCCEGLQCNDDTSECVPKEENPTKDVCVKEWDGQGCPKQGDQCGEYLPCCEGLQCNNIFGCNVCLRKEENPTKDVCMPEGSTCGPLEPCCENLKCEYSTEGFLFCAPEQEDSDSKKQDG